MQAENTQRVSPMTRKVLDYLSRVEYRRCDFSEDFEQICRLRFKAYQANGLLSADAGARVFDTMDELPNCYNFGVYHDGALVSTLRIHHLHAEAPEGPSTVIHKDLIAPRIAAGERFVDPSRFASDPEWMSRNPEIPFITLRLAVMACIHFDVPYCLSTIRPEHAAFYKRIFNSRQIGELRSYPRITRQVALYEADVKAIRSISFIRYPFFRSEPLEQRLLFERDASGMAPLTVLPSISSQRFAA